jgi:hypothetical protein
MTKKTENEYYKWAIEYLKDTYNTTEDESMSILASNPELLTPIFGLVILAHHYAKEI